MISEQEHALRRASEALPIRDQGGIQSCVAICLVDALSLVGALPEGVRGSALFVHHFARAELGQMNRNYGIPPDTAIKALATYGLCRDAQFPDSLNSFRAVPNKQTIQSAIHPSCSFETLKSDLDPLRAALTQGNPVMICLRLSTKIMRSFTDGAIAKTGDMPPPDAEVGHANHAVLCVGYDTQSNSLLCRNSLGATWGDKGYLHLPSSWLAGEHSYGFRACLGHIPTGSERPDGRYSD